MSYLILLLIGMAFLLTASLINLRLKSAALKEKVRENRVLRHDIKLLQQVEKEVSDMSDIAVIEQLHREWQRP